MTYKQVLEKAKKRKPDIDTVAEYEDAYVFYNSKAKGVEQENNEVVVLKDNGKIISMTQYVMTTTSDKNPNVRGI